MSYSLIITSCVSLYTLPTSKIIMILAIKLYKHLINLDYIICKLFLIIKRYYPIKMYLKK